MITGVIANTGEVSISDKGAIIFLPGGVGRPLYVCKGGDQKNWQPAITDRQPSPTGKNESFLIFEYLKYPVGT